MSNFNIRDKKVQTVLNEFSQIYPNLTEENKNDIKESIIKILKNISYKDFLNLTAIYNTEILKYLKFLTINYNSDYLYDKNTKYYLENYEHDDKEPIDKNLNLQYGWYAYWNDHKQYLIYCKVEMNESTNLNGTDWGHVKYCLLLPIQRETSEDTSEQQERINAYAHLALFEKNVFNYFAVSNKGKCVQAKDKDKDKDKDFIHFMLPERCYKKTQDPLSDTRLVVSIFEREIITKLIYYNMHHIKNKKYKFAMDSLDPKYCNDEIEYLLRFEKFVQRRDFLKEFVGSHGAWLDNCIRQNYLSQYLNRNQEEREVLKFLREYVIDSIGAVRRTRRCRMLLMHFSGLLSQGISNCLDKKHYNTLGYLDYHSVDVVLKKVFLKYGEFMNKNFKNEMLDSILELKNDPRPKGKKKKGRGKKNADQDSLSPTIFDFHYPTGTYQCTDDEIEIIDLEEGTSEATRPLPVPVLNSNFISNDSEDTTREDSVYGAVYAIDYNFSCGKREVGKLQVEGWLDPLFAQRYDYLHYRKCVVIKKDLMIIARKRSRDTASEMETKPNSLVTKSSVGLKHIRQQFNIKKLQYDIPKINTIKTKVQNDHNLEFKLYISIFEIVIMFNFRIYECYGKMRSIYQSLTQYFRTIPSRTMQIKIDFTKNEKMIVSNHNNYLFVYVEMFPFALKYTGKTRYLYKSNYYKRNFNKKIRLKIKQSLKSRLKKKLNENDFDLDEYIQSINYTTEDCNEYRLNNNDLISKLNARNNRHSWDLLNYTAYTNNNREFRSRKETYSNYEQFERTSTIKTNPNKKKYSYKRKKSEMKRQFNVINNLFEEELSDEEEYAQAYQMQGEDDQDSSMDVEVQPHYTHYASADYQPSAQLGDDVLGTFQRNVQSNFDFIYTQCLEEFRFNFTPGSLSLWALLERNKALIYSTMPAKLHLLADLYAFFSRLHRDVTVHIYGSFSTGLCLHQSDVDLVLSYAQDLEKSQAVQKLREIRAAMESLPWVKKIDLIVTAKVPIIKCEVEAAGPLARVRLPLDLSIQSTELKHAGKYAALFVNSIKEKYYGYVPLVLLLKMLLAAYSLNNNYTGGLCSYSLNLMVGFYLDWRKYQYGEAEEDLGDLFKGLLSFYQEFDFGRWKIYYDTMLNSFSYVCKDSPNKLVEILDPLDMNNNTSKNCYKMDDIKQLMTNLLQILNNNKNNHNLSHIILKFFKFDDNPDE